MSTEGFHISLTQLSLTLTPYVTTVRLPEPGNLRWYNTMNVKALFEFHQFRHILFLDPGSYPEPKLH